MERHYDFKKTEKEMQIFWRENGVYKYDPDSEKKTYSIDTPPPTVSGALHIGHIFSYTQAEMIARFRRMQGYNVFYPFGFDDNGLPTERLVEKENGIAAKSLPRSEFIRECTLTAGIYEKEFMDLWKSLGFSVDWSLQYETISPLSQRISQRSFLELYKKGKAYLKESPVLWCTECGTSIAQAELEVTEKETAFHYLPFAVGEETIPVATTRPELLYGCVCLFVNPSDERYSRFVGKAARVPLYDFEIPILTDEKAHTEKGTGCVMCATYGDSTDAEWAEKYSLPYRRVILPNGKIAEDVPLIGGLTTAAGRKEILRLLSEKGLLLRLETLRHSVAVHERCGKEVEIIPSKQWYIDILSEKGRLLKSADRIRWYPEMMKNRYTAWVQNLKWDWCISRQRYFGVPFPVWYCKGCGKVLLADEAQLPVNPLESKPKEPCVCGCTDFIPEAAVMDTWATSSLTPQINSRWGEADDRSSQLLPMGMRTQAHEIIRTWAFYTIVKSLYHTGRLPWKDIMICGFVLAKKGEKFSKSKNNAELSPQALINQYSADVLRYWAANAKLGTDTFFSEDELKIAQRFVTKLWNAARFAFYNLEDYQPGRTARLTPVDQWIMERCRQTVKETAKLLGRYEIGSARHLIDDFFWKDFCDNYLELIKERLYEPQIRGKAERKAAQHALYFCTLNLLKLYAIYTPHITESLYQEFFRRYEKAISIHTLLWLKPKKIDSERIAFGEELKNVIADTRKRKSEQRQSLKTPVESVLLPKNTRFLNWYQASEGDLKACCRTKKMEMST